VTAYATVVAYGRAFFDRRLLNEFCNNQIFSGTVGLMNAVLEVEGISEVDATYPSPVLSVELF
jgi:hypothetical protein